MQNRLKTLYLLDRIASLEMKPAMLLLE